MNLPADARELLGAAAASPDDVRLRQVVADHLIDAGHPLGELLRLELEERDLPRRRVLEAMLRQRPQALVPWANELELERGLPAWANAGAAATPAALDAESLPVEWVTVTADVRTVTAMLGTRALRMVRALDLSLASAAPGASARTTNAAPAVRALWLPMGEPLDSEFAAVFPNVSEVSVGVGPGFVLPRWVLELPSLERIVLLPSREPGGGEVVPVAFEWAERRKGPCLEWLGQRLDARAARRALTPGLPGERPSLPEDVHLGLELVREADGSRVVRETGGPRTFLRCDDAPAADVFSAPRHPHLVATKGPVRIRRAQYVELEDPGEPFPVARHPPAQALGFARSFVSALEAWWGTGAPDAFDGEWVGLGRDQLRLRDGALVLVPALTRRLGPVDRTLLDVIGLPVPWGRTSQMIVQLTAAAVFEWLSGLPFLEARAGSALAVHRRLELRRRQPPSLAGIDDALRGYDEPLHAALGHPEAWTPSSLLTALTSGSSSRG